MVFSKAQLLGDVISYLESNLNPDCLEEHLQEAGHVPGTKQHAMDLLRQLHQQLDAAEFAEELADEYRELRPPQLIDSDAAG